MLSTRIAGDDGQTPLRRLLLKLLDLTEHFDSAPTTDDWIEIFDADEHRRSDTSHRPTNDESAAASETPFESIGDGDDSELTKRREATIEGTGTARSDNRIVLGLSFPQMLQPRHVDALEEGLIHHLRTKFEILVDPVDESDLGSRAPALPSTARTRLYFQTEPVDNRNSRAELKRDINEFLDRLERFSSFGVDLFEYLGVGETVLNTDGFSDGKRREDLDESQLSFRRRTSERGDAPRDTAPTVEPTDETTVLDLGDGTDRLESKNYTDPRLRREDADTALVDVVLRHPGYSDSRIGQVLSILLSIEYHDALDIADNAPCVIAWGVSQKRARRFKDVIESAGGKVVLVEPETFGEK